MGSVRFLLAVSVVFAHTSDIFLLVGGQLAVQLFFVISGYLISFVLLTAKTYDSKRDFYINRALRIFPVYWLIAFLTFLLIIFAEYFFQTTHPAISTFTAIDPVGKWCLIISNLFIFGQDWIMFTGVTDGAVRFVIDFTDSPILVYRSLLVPQAWTLGIELTFYILAPFILLNKNRIIFLLAASILLRIYLIHLGFGDKDPWTYRFFPTELALFLAGALSHQYMYPIFQSKGFLKPMSVKLITFLAIFYILNYSNIVEYQFSIFLTLALFCIILPFLFVFQKNFSLDNYLGNLSYPIYISHILVMWIINFMFRYFELEWNRFLFALIVLFSTIFFSILINFTVERFIEKYRQKFKSNN